MPRKSAKRSVKKKSQHFKITAKQLIDAMVAEFSRSYRTINLLTHPSDKQYIDYTIGIDIGYSCISEAGLTPLCQDEDTFSVLIGHPFEIYNGVKQGIIGKLYPSDFLIDLEIHDASDDYWDFDWSFTIRKKLNLECDIQPCHDLSDCDEENDLDY